MGELNINFNVLYDMDMSRPTIHSIGSRKLVMTIFWTSSIYARKGYSINKKIVKDISRIICNKFICY